MSREGIISNFAAYEASHAVENYTCFDWNCWPLLRIVCSYQLNQRQKSSAPPGTAFRLQKISNVASSTPGLGWLRNRIQIRRMEQALEKALEKDPEHNDAPDKSAMDVAILTHSGRRTKLGESLFDIYSDPIVQKLHAQGLSCLVWEQGPERWPRRSNSAWVSKRLAMATASTANHIEKQPPDWFRDFSSWSKHTFSFQIPWTEFRMIIHSVQSMSLVFGDWLARSNAKLLISICWYDPTVMAATLAARRLDIPSVDLQHGIQDSGHFAYSGWNHIPPRPYELVPNYFWLWGSAGADRLMLGNPSFKAFSGTFTGGNLWYNQWRGDTSYQKDLPESIFKGRKVKKIITVTLQHGPANFSDLIVTLVEKCSHEWFWLIRFHPATPSHEAKHIRDTLNSLTKDNFDFEASSTLTLYTLLAVCDVHITGHSTSALEALGFGKPTITVNKNGAAAFREYINEGVMIAADEITNIESAIQEASNIPADKCRNSVAAVFATTPTAEQDISKLLAIANVRGH